MLLSGLTSLLAMTTQPKPGRLTVVGAAWPPSRASPLHTWQEGISAGPLGLTADALFERQFRRGLARELGRDVPREGYAGVMEICRELVSERGADVSAASRRVLMGLFPDVSSPTHQSSPFPGSAEPHIRRPYSV